MKVVKAVSLQTLLGKKWDKETVHLLYDQNKEKTKYSVFRNRCDERHHKNLMPRHLLDDKDQFLNSSGMTKI
jgi:hypothetical protein